MNNLIFILHVLELNIRTRLIVMLLRLVRLRVDRHLLNPPKS